MKKNRIGHGIMAIVLAVIMIVGIVPIAALAENGGTITAFDVSKTEKTVEAGTEIADIGLPDKLVATMENGEKMQIPVTWECDLYNKDVAGTYTFTAVLASGYTYAEARPTAAITVKAPETLSKEGFAANGTGEVNQGLIAEFLPVTNDRNTGGIGQMRLYSSLSSTDNDEYAVVHLPITSVPGLEFPQFAANEAGDLVFEVEGTQFTLVKDEEGNPSYIEYRLGVGDTVVALLQVKVPNGYSSNPTKVTFGEPEPQLDEDDKPTFTGNQELTGGELSYNAKFGWQPVNINASTSTTQVVRAESGYSLKNDINYTITAANAYGGAKTGVIYTAGYTLENTLILPDGVEFPAGERELSADGMTLTIDGVTIATFSQPVESAAITGNNTLEFKYAKDNDTLDASGNPAEGKTAAELANLSLNVKLVGTKLKVTNPDTANGGKITHATSFEAVPCKQNASNSASTDDVETNITVPDEAVSVTKSNSPKGGGERYARNQSNKPY